MSALTLTAKDATVINPADKSKSKVQYNRIKLAEGATPEDAFAEILNSVFNGNMGKLVSALIAGANKDAKANANPFRTAQRDARKKVTAAKKMFKLFVETLGDSPESALSKVNVAFGMTFNLSDFQTEK